MKGRWHQLPIFLRHLHQVLVSQWRHYTIFVVEQAGILIYYDLKHLARNPNCSKLLFYRRGSFQPREITQRRCHRSLENSFRFGLLNLARRRHAPRDQFRHLQMPRRSPIRPSNGHLSEQKRLPVIVYYHLKLTYKYSTATATSPNSSTQLYPAENENYRWNTIVTLQLVRWHEYEGDLKKKE